MNTRRAPAIFALLLSPFLALSMLPLPACARDSTDQRAILVTGASSGIGRKITERLASEGYFVYAGARKDKDLAELDAMENVQAVRLDVTVDADIEAAVATVTEAGRGLYGLVNNAGVLSEAPLEDLTDEDLEESLDINLRGTLVCTRATVPHMVARGAGRVISAASMSTRIGAVGLTAYSASKGAIVGMTRTWARELGPKGITANAVAPGLIDSETTSTVPAGELEATLSRLPARRLGRPEEVAAVYVFLASDLSSFINGAILGVDGGLFLV